jgi:hypothetical protein
MPRINWVNLPAWKRRKLEDRVRAREITAIDLRRLQEWIASEPDVPDEEWCKDFGSFQGCWQGFRTVYFLNEKPALLGQATSLN